MTFNDLSFEAHGSMQMARVFFPNGYGASVVQGPFSYGGTEGLFELAVLAGDEHKSLLTYDTPITEDVEGHLTPDDVTRLLHAIEALPPDATAFQNALKRQELTYATLGLSKVVR